ncbi:MAG: hypothetical protein JKY51_02425 [Opitutaceae bacterium]|nr:hypothetical protein [Opitutaceae bacterium]
MNPLLKLLRWFTILSLDAASVALVWQLAFARTFQLSLGWHHSVILVLAVWLAYAADRWFDGWRLEKDNPQSERHRFYRSNRRLLPFIWIPLFATSIFLSIHRLSATELRSGLYLLSATLLYFGLIHLIQIKEHKGLPKEIGTGLLFAAGVGLFLFPGSIDPLLPLYLCLFGLLCFVNCAFIGIWEEDNDKEQRQASLARHHPSIIHWIPAIAPFLSLLSLLPLLWDSAYTLWPLAASFSASFLLLDLLHRTHRNIPVKIIRPLADLVLLSPLILLLFL